MIKHIIVILTLVVLLLMNLNCGKKGPLTLEPEILPTEIVGFSVKQIGATITLKWNFPQYLSDNETEFDVSRVKKFFVYYSDFEIPFEKFRKKSTVLVKTVFNNITIKGDSYTIDLPFKKKDLKDKKHFFALRYYYLKKKSPISQVKVLKTVIPIKPITDLKVSKENKVLKFKWTRPETDISGAKFKKIAGYKVYRRIESEEDTSEKNEFEKINTEKVLYEYFEDQNTSTEGQYSYYVSAVISDNIESEPSNLLMIRVKDIYPPDVPANLVVFKAKDHLYLTWEKVKDKDLAHYRVYKRSLKKGGGFSLLADKLEAEQYKDTTVIEGTTYVYYITSVDEKGNESEGSDKIKERF
jgi:hypothetical protein